MPLYDIVAAAHRANADESLEVGDIGGRFDEWRLREVVITSYIKNFEFEP